MHLHEYITENAWTIIDEWSRRMRRALAPDAMSTLELRDNVPVFLTQVATALASASKGTRTPPQGNRPVLPNKSPIAHEHGAQRLKAGFDPSTLVREYFGLRSCILELASSAGVWVSAAEAEIVTQCIATGIADAMRAYCEGRDELMRQQASKHLGFLAHELRNCLGAAWLALLSMERSTATRESRPFQVLQRNVGRMRQLIDRALVDARLKARADLFLEHLDLRAIVDQLVAESTVEDKRIRVAVSFEGTPVLEGDARLLQSALSNLIHNAVKFTREGGAVSVQTQAAQGRVVVHVEDECGGLPEGALDKIFDPFVQSGANRTGFGLGLAIAKQAAEAHNGAIRVHNLPGKGCVFTLDLPQQQS